MKSVPFNYESRSWDRYKAFHCVDGQFTQFETGEVITTNGYSRPDYRFRDRRGVSILATKDHWCPRLYTDEALKDPVPAAWLNEDGQQYLAIDHQQGVAVRLSSPYQDTNKQFVPAHLKGAAAIWVRPDQKPLSLTPIHLSMPDKEFRKAMWRKLREVRSVALASAKLRGIPDNWGTTKASVFRTWLDKPTEEIIEEVLSDEVTTRWVAYGGWDYPRLAVTCDYLYTEKGA